MRRLLAALLAVVLVCSMSFPAFAAEETKEIDVTVNVTDWGTEIAEADRKLTSAQIYSPTPMQKGSKKAFTVTQTAIRNPGATGSN